MAAVALEATNRCKKLMKFGLSIFRKSFNSSKCKTIAKMATARIKLLRNKREVVVRQMRRDVALLLQSGQDATARIRVEHVIREQNVMAANEIIELFCELVVSRLSIIAKQRECPADLKEGISSLIFAGPRCSDIPELLAIRDLFEKKYGKDFVSAATDLRPNCGVNRRLIEKLSVRTPTGEVKLKVMKEIAKEYQIKWDTTETEMELLKPPEELIEGPQAFVSAASMPVKPISVQSSRRTELDATRPSCGGDVVQFENAALAAEAAAESAKKAIAAAQAAAYMANKPPNLVTQAPAVDNNSNAFYSSIATNSYGLSMPSEPPLSSRDVQSETPWKSESQDFGRPPYLNNETKAGGSMHRRHSYNSPYAHSDLKFDESDCDEKSEMEKPADAIHQPPDRSPPAVPSSLVCPPVDRTTTDNSYSHTQNPVFRVHPKLPDYDSLAARFEALKYRNSLP